MFDSPQTSTRATQQFDAAGLAVRDKAIRAFDRDMHNMINAAQSVGQWERVADKLVAAHKVGDYKEPRGLRNAVLNHFIEACPFGPVKRRYYDGVKEPVGRSYVVRRATEVDGPTKRQRADAKRKARADRDREERFNKKGPSNKTEPSHGSAKQKGTKKK